MNPYEELAQIIETWAKRTGNAEKKRFNNKQGFERWEQVRQAFKCLVEIDELTADNPRRRVLLDALWEYLVHPNVPWNNHEGRGLKFAPGHLEHLHTLADVHTVDPDDAQTLSPQEINVLRETMQLIKSDLHKHAEVLGKAGKRLQKLVDSCLALLDEPEVNDAAVREKSEQIFGAVIPASLNIEDESDRHGFVGNAARAVAVFTRDVAAGASGALVGDTLVRMITGG